MENFDNLVKKERNFTAPFKNEVLIQINVIIILYLYNIK